MVGGDQTAFDKVMPLFELMGQNITLVGSNGAGQTCKVANQIIVALTIEAVGEALLFASKAGADPAKVRQALMGGFASSKILEIHGERMIKRTFDPGFRITLHQKDLNLALSNARKLQMALPNTAFAQELFNSVAAQGNAELDHSAMVLALEKLAGSFAMGGREFCSEPDFKIQIVRKECEPCQKLRLSTHRKRRRFSVRFPRV
jgi:2-hydroxy-3-oxopropionate reductase